MKNWDFIGNEWKKKNKTENKNAQLVTQLVNILLDKKAINFWTNFSYQMEEKIIVLDHFFSVI